MTGLLVVSVACLAAALLGSVAEGVFLAEQSRRLHAENRRLLRENITARTQASAAEAVAFRRGARLRVLGQDPDGRRS